MQASGSRGGVRAERWLGIEPPARSVGGHDDESKGGGGGFLGSGKMEVGWLGGSRERNPEEEGIWRRWDKLPNNKEEQVAAASGLGRNGWDSLGLGVDLFW